MIERRYSLRQAEKLTGIGRATLKAWLAAELPDFPRLPRGAKFLVRESDLERVLRKRGPQANPTRLRRLRERLAIQPPGAERKAS